MTSLPHSSLLGALDLQEVVETPVLAKQLHMKSANLHYALRTLTEQGRLRRRARINFFRLGFFDFGIFLSISCAPRKRQESFEKHVAADERTSWLGRLAGEFQYAMIYFAQSMCGVSDYLDRLNALSGIDISARILSPRLAYTQYNKKYLAVPKSAPRQHDFRSTPQVVRIDDLDHRILSHLGAHDFDSLRAVARALGEPHSTVERRVERMRREEVIMGFYYEVNSLAIGVKTFRLLISTRSAQPDLQRRLANFCRAHPAITFMIKAIGSWDYELIFETNSTSEPLQMIGEISELLGSELTAIRTVQEIEDLKWSFYPFKKNPLVGLAA